MTPSRIVLLVSAAIYLAFHLWFGGADEPLSQEETEAYLAQIGANQTEASAHDGDLIDSFRALAAEDDGREFYMLNLMRYRPKALYPPGSPYGEDARAAADRYNQAVLPALFRRGSMPILLGRYAGPFIPPDASAGTWDQIGIVRYRSRRDMLDMALELSLSGGGEHKWASIEETIVFPVSPILDFVFVRGLVATIVFGIGGSLAFALRRKAG